MEQVERAHRYLERIRDAYAGVPFRDDGRDYYADDVHSFFVHCHHIGDWVATLNTVGVTKKQVDKFVAAHLELLICADLCNGTKHCRLRKLQTSRQPHVAGHRLTSSGVSRDDESAPTGTTQCQFEVLAEGQYYDALWLAESCMRLWDDFVDGLEHQVGSAST